MKPILAPLSCSVFIMIVFVLFTDVTCNLLPSCVFPRSGHVCSRIKSVVVEKEVCRLEISGDQLLLGCVPGHFGNLVNNNYSLLMVCFSCCI